MSADAVYRHGPVVARQIDSPHVSRREGMKGFAAGLDGEFVGAFL